MASASWVTQGTGLGVPNQRTGSRWNRSAAWPARWSRRPWRPNCSSTQESRHLFTDRSLPSYDEDAATLLTERVLSFLGD